MDLDQMMFRKTAKEIVRSKRKAGLLSRMFSGGLTLGAVVGVFALVLLTVGLVLLPYIVVAHFVVKYW